MAKKDTGTKVHFGIFESQLNILQREGRTLF